MKILRLPGWELNPVDSKLNSIIRAIGRNDGECPCKHDEWDDNTPQEDKICPCKTYRDGNGCHCGLYLKVCHG